jgi:Domain of unknown function (DUF4832)
MCVLVPPSHCPRRGTRTSYTRRTPCFWVLLPRDGATVVLDNRTVAIPLKILGLPMLIVIALVVLALIPCRSVFATECSTAGKEQITFRCDYAARPRAASEMLDGTQIVLNRAILSFSVNEESHLVIRLTFTNVGRVQLSEPRMVYLAVDDDAGANYLRRPLPAIDLRQIVPGKQITFSDQLLSPAFRAGHYRIAIWVPSAKPSLQFDPAHNFIFSSVGVADLSTGLNILGTFTVVDSDRSKHKRP